jgi:DNA-binding transcriptional MocR family regulator
MKRAVNESPLYLKVARKLEGQIEQGAFAIGDQIPSVRQLSRQHRVSVSTVLQAYFWLENKGWIEARPKSGFYVRGVSEHVSPVPVCRPTPCKPTPVTSSELVADLLQASPRAVKVSFGAAFAGPEILPTNQMNSILRRISRRAPTHAVHHAHAPGSWSLRQQIARRSVAAGCNFVPEDITITCGALEGLNLALRAIGKPGAVVATESPTFFNILQAVESLGMKAIEIPTDCETGMNLEFLEKALKNHRVSACISITNCHNPLGYILSDEKKKALVELLDRYDAPLIEDDVYGDLAFQPQRPLLAKSFDRNGRVIVCGSFSKTISPGLRLGWVHSERYQSRITQLKLITNIASPSLSEAVVTEFLESGGYDRNVRQMRACFEHQIRTYRHAISKYFPEGTAISRPMGGYVLWVEMPKKVDSVALYHAAMKEGISISPGPIFSASGKYRNYMRLNCGLKWSDEIDRALLKLGRLCEAQHGV